MDVYQRGPDYIAEDTNITFRFSKITEHSDGYSAWMTVTTDGLPGVVNGSIFNSKIQFGGPNSKRDAAKECNDRVRLEDIDWRGLIEEAIFKVMAHLEEGEPILDLGTVDLPGPKKYLIHPIVAEEVTMIYALGGSGKSLFVLDLLAQLSRDGVKCLFVDWEDSWETHAHRLDMLTRGQGYGVRPAVRYKRMEGSLISQGDALSRQIAAEGIQFAAFDSVGLACSPEPERAEAATGYMRVVRSLNLRGSLHIAHHRKEEDKYPFGSIFWYNSVRSLWLLKKTHEIGSGDMEVGLYHKKVNNGITHKAQGYSLQFGANSVSITKTDVTKIIDLRKELSIAMQIEAAISDLQGYGTRDAVFQKCKDANESLKRESFNRTVRRLVDNGKVADAGNRLYLKDMAELG